MAYVGKQPQPKFLGQVDDLTVAGDVNVDTNTLVVDADNNRVGIGTSPSEAFHVNSGIDNDCALFESTDNIAAITIADNSGSVQVRSRDSGEMTFHIGGDASVAGTSSTEAMRIDSSGNVGIGTSSPAFPLQIVDSGTTANVEIESSLSTGAADTGGLVILSGHNGTTASRDYVYIKGAKENSTVGNDDSYFSISTRKTGGIPAERMRIDSSGNVGIGTSDPVQQSGIGLHINNASGQARLKLTSSVDGATANDGFDIIKEAGGGDVHLLNHENTNLKFGTNDSERMRIDSSGNVTIGKTTANNTTEGFTHYGGAGGSSIVKDGGAPLILNRNTNDGAIAIFRKDNSTVGSIGVDSSGNYLTVGDAATSLRFIDSATDRIEPWNQSSNATRDNLIDLGTSGNRFNDVFAANGVTTTSDRNEKQDIATLTTAEMAVAARLSNQFKTFRWIDSVTEKGENARTHTGIIAQDVQQAFADEGLDAGDYGLFISGTWWETQTEVPAVEAVEAQDAVYDEDGNLVSEAIEAVEAQEAYTRTDTYDTADEAPEGATERTRLGIRYPELLSFMQAYNDQRMASIEARLDALEAN
jgi:hypothetical protein